MANYDGAILPTKKIDLSLKKPLHFVVRRSKTTIFVNADEDMTVLQFKQMISKVIKLPFDKFRMCKEDLTPLDSKLKDLKQKLKAMGYWIENTPPHDPATVFIRYWIGYTSNGKPVFEELDITGYSTAASEHQKSLSLTSLKSQEINM